MERLDLWEGEDLRISRSEGSLRGRLVFEFVSWVGRHVPGRGPPAATAPHRLLNAGCGASLFDGWINADVFRLRFWQVPKGVWLVDLRHPLPCPADHWDGVFCEHVLEHLFAWEAMAFLRDLRRTMKPGARVRLSVPDLRRYARHYLDQEHHERFERWPLPAAAVRGLTQGWGHRSLWDAELLAAALRDAGFTDVAECQFRQGGDDRLLQDAPERRWESVYVEASKPA